MERSINQIFRGKPTLEGAGVRLSRVFGYHNIPQFDPFLLLDHFGSDNPDDYIKGFPWHPHRGIETVTYILAGKIEHGDSLGNTGTINSGDIQWMTAGSGIIHQEMPQTYTGTMQGFQLWVNLPAEKKMMEPRYQEIEHQDVPQVNYHDATIKIIAGKIDKTYGQVKNLIVDVSYFDITLPKGKSFTYTTPKQYTALAYTISGSAKIQTTIIESQHCILFNHGDDVFIQAQTPLRFLLITGRPLHEPVAWGGPVVMNTQQELDQAFKEIDKGTFIKHQSPRKPAMNYYKQ